MATALRSSGELVRQRSHLRPILIALIAIVATASFAPDLWRSTHFGFGGASDDVPVLVAGHFIPAFTVLKPGQIRVKMTPREFVPPGALHGTGDLLKEEGQAMYSTIVGVPEGHPLTRALLYETGKDHGLSSLLRPGHVAVSFKVDRERSAGGWVHPGDTIAVFERTLSLDNSRTEHAQTHLLLNAVEVLAVDRAHLGRDAGDNDRPDNAVEASLRDMNDQILTVLVNTADAAALVDAQRRGPLTIVLRPLGDDLPWIPVNRGGRP